MSLVHRHLDRCHQDRHVMAATIGVGFYGTLALVVLAYDLLSLWH